MRYYIADPHFFHGNLNARMDCRGFATVEEMNAYMLKRWNDKVRPRDEVVILGDLSWGSAEQTNALLEQLNGRLHLIQGNHDRFGRNGQYRTDRFVWVRPYAEVHDGKRKVILCHYPVFCYNGQYRLDDKGNPKSYMLYGHVHDTQDQRLVEQFQAITRAHFCKIGEETHPIPCHMINCFCMYSDYTPLTLDEWIACDRARMERRARDEAARRMEQNSAGK